MVVVGRNFFSDAAYATDGLTGRKIFCALSSETRKLRSCHSHFLRLFDTRPQDRQA